MDTVLGAGNKSEAEAIAKAFDGSQIEDVEPEDGVVIYSGPATIREISKADWKKRGIDAEGTLWNRRNKYRVSTSELTEEQLDVLKEDPAFTIG